MVSSSSLDLSKSSHLPKTYISLDFFINDKLREVDFLVVILEENVK